ncbi:hypothetical protein G7046_g5938 [Stylonectria norvegica]|nr:hypothetical protein G7046_g5938 [Stylonectria norvegica]
MSSSDMKSLAKDLGLTYTTFQYGSHNLQNLGVWQTPDAAYRSTGYWIIFIHGGAWRDPRNTHQDFWPSIQEIISDHGAHPEIRGYISLDYRLSPKLPEFPQDPTTTPPTELRDALHPDHIQDIWSGLEYLHVNFQMTNDYILVGHSAGATLAYQLLMGDVPLAGRPRPEVRLPTAIIGISGIYDLTNINARHDGQYASLISNAFGDEAGWASASPARFGESFKETWTEGKFTLLAWSPADTLIDEPEIDDMAARLTRDGVSVDVVKDLTGEHDFVWEDGKQVARLVTLTLAKLRDV